MTEQYVWMVREDDGDYYQHLEPVGIYTTKEAAVARAHAEHAETEARHARIGRRAVRDLPAPSVIDEDGTTFIDFHNGYHYEIDRWPLLAD